MQEFNINKKAEWSNGIRAKYNISPDEFVYGFSGRVSADKGCGELLSAFKRVLDNNHNAKLFVVGSLEENGKIAPELLTWAKENQSVIFTGSIDKSEMRMYYSAMDVLVHPTYREGFGMVIQEAGALAVPVITTKIPGASEVMEDGKSCYLVEAKNVDELSAAMLRSICNRDELKALGEGAYIRTAQLYDRPKMLENLKRDYIELLEKR